MINSFIKSNWLGTVNFVQIEAVIFSNICNIFLCYLRSFNIFFYCSGTLSALIYFTFSFVLAISNYIGSTLLVLRHQDCPGLPKYLFFRQALNPLPQWQTDRRYLFYTLSYLCQGLFHDLVFRMSCDMTEPSYVTFARAKLSYLLSGSKKYLIS